MGLVEEACWRACSPPPRTHTALLLTCPLSQPCLATPALPQQASEDLVRKKVRDPSDFEWLKQCRFAWRDDRDTVVISICDVDFEYR